MASADMIRESQDPSTTAARLAELAQLDRGLWTSIAVHPAAYPALLEWLGQQGDPTVDAVLELRSGSPATAAAPAGPPPPPADTPSAHVGHASVPPVNNEVSSTHGSAGDGSKNVWVVGGMIAVVLVLIGGIAFGATKVFGGDDDKDEASPSQTVDAPKPSAPPTVTRPTLDSPTLDSPTLGSPSSSSSLALFCEGFKSLVSVITANPDAKPGSGPVKSMVSILDNVERFAPAEVKSDVGIMATYFRTLSDPNAFDGTPPAELTAAQKRAADYYTANCR
ncbi:variant leucine-rich repeat-containing protein [Aeromicrobium fastidiosum]|uniref:Leucine rich repeat variant domain-containing protein n=1 Tax=Aeromicrobium fastidiosum TaxID=52699 RepID=A0A641AQ65_9ACTN|nr:hypothetical protein [Aeromicrobium fastidiosum]KAA1380244.1 hypothetical protein ESP62_003345 [Aeromicrobium fastidiosum]MBP2389795.1 hypothetical protein [Aeromicrobium fastidiosum]